MLKLEAEISCRQVCRSAVRSFQRDASVWDHHRSPAEAACAHYPTAQSGSGLGLTYIAHQCKSPAETFPESFHGKGRKNFHQGPSAHLLVLIVRV